MFPQNGLKDKAWKEELMDIVLKLFHFFKRRIVKGIIKFDPMFIGL